MTTEEKGADQQGDLTGTAAGVGGMAPAATGHPSITVRRAATVGPHVRLQVFAGPDADHRALCGELVMLKDEAVEFEARILDYHAAVAERDGAVSELLETP